MNFILKKLFVAKKRKFTDRLHLQTILIMLYNNSGRK